MFSLRQNNTTPRIEITAGITTFLTMAYIIFVQPAVLSGAMFGFETGMDFGAVLTATCLAAAVATLIMGLYANYPIAQAPGMGLNFFFVFSAIPAAAAMGAEKPWQVALGAIFISGVLFLLITVLGIRSLLLKAISDSQKHAIAVGIGLFIAFIGLRNSGIIVNNAGTGISLSHEMRSPDVLIFFFGLFLTSALFARRFRGAILWGIFASTIVTLGAWLLFRGSTNEVLANSKLLTLFQPAKAIFSTPPSIAPTFMQMDIAGALTMTMIPFIIVFLFMDVFDTMGTLIGVGKEAGMLVNGELPRAKEAFLSDAVGTMVGAGLGTSTVTSFIESASGVEQGGRTGLTAVVVAILFLAAPFFTPIIQMVGSYPPITAPALVIVGALMVKSVMNIDWSDASEGIPAFLIMIGIPLTFSIADGMALGFIAYPIIKIISGRGREVTALGYVLAVILILYFIFIRSRI